MTRLPLILAALLLAAPPVFAQTTIADSPTTDSGGQMPKVTTDEEFIRLATSSNLLEIRSSEQAAQKAQSQEVRDFAAKMVTDHQAASEALAAASGQSVPDPATYPPQLDPRHAELLAQLESAPAFDTAYAALQVQAHEEAVALFTDYATNGQEGAVKDFAEATLPKLQEHLEQAQALPQQ